MPTPKKPSSPTSQPVPVAQDEPPEHDLDRPYAVGIPVDGDVEAETVAEETPWGFAQPFEGTPMEPGSDEPGVVERPRDELFVAIACAVLAASVFLPWYGTLISSQSGWASGTWGPVVFFLALAGIAIVALRRMKVPVSFPYDHSLVLEGIGWVSVVFTFIKRFRPPHIGTIAAGQKYGIIVAMFAAVAVALLGGRVSSAASLVQRPGWLKDRGGKTGALVLAISIALGAVFAFANGGEPGAPKPIANNQSVPKTFKGLPPCATKQRFPTPAGVKATQGQEVTATGSQLSFCFAVFTSSLPAKTVFDRFKAALTANGWKYIATKTTSAVSAGLTLTSPQCGTVAIQQPPKPTTGSKAPKVSTTISAYFSKCSIPAPRKT